MLYFFFFYIIFIKNTTKNDAKKYPCVFVVKDINLSKKYTFKENVRKQFFDKNLFFEAFLKYIRIYESIILSLRVIF